MSEVSEEQAKAGSWKAGFLVSFAFTVAAALYDGRLGLFSLSLILAFVALIWLARKLPKLGVVLGLGFVSGPFWIWHYKLFDPKLSILLIFTGLGAIASVVVGAFMLWAALDRTEYTDEEQRAIAEKALRGLQDRR
jgi:hypothetical protein